MNVSIFGLGYVGCVSLGCLARNGFNVIGVDVSQHKVDLINAGKPTIIEKDIDKIIRDEFLKGKISATTDFESAVVNSDVSIICVGTPSTKEGHLNLNFINKVANEIGVALKKKESFHTIVIRSTVLPGTNRNVSQIIESSSGKVLGKDFGVVSNPEFLREGSAVQDYYKPAVTVIGSDSKKSINMVKGLYEKVDAPIHCVDIEEAEIIKYVNNAFHALKISFANEVGNICKKLDINSRNVMDLFCQDHQLNISPYYFKPGFAYGGSCLPKDLKGLQTLAHDNYLKSPVIGSIEESNSNQKRIAIELVESFDKKEIGILGLSFKAGTDDLRYSPIVEVAEYFLGKNYRLKVFDKNVSISQLTGTNKDYIEEHIPHLSKLFVSELEDLVSGTELIIITHGFEGIDEFLIKYPNKIFIDLVGLNIKKTDNYYGICW